LPDTVIAAFAVAITKFFQKMIQDTLLFLNLTPFDEEYCSLLFKLDSVINCYSIDN
jgi:hypothetical protein